MYQQIAQLIQDNYLKYKSDFEQSCMMARLRFENKLWGTDPATTAYRLQLYVNHTVEVKNQILNINSKMSSSVWLEIKRAYQLLIADFEIPEHARTFFNSITRHFFQNTYFNRDIYFQLVEDTERILSLQSITINKHDASIKKLIESIEWNCDTSQTESSILTETFFEKMDTESLELEYYPHLFYRDKEAYLIGNIKNKNLSKTAFAIQLSNETNGIVVEKVLTGEREVKRIFDFTRSYFWVYAPDPIAMVNYLKSIMPSKPREQLFINTGYIRHGKSVMYHHLMDKLGKSESRLVVAPGIKGLVMQVFTLPDYHLVFKIIKDKSSPPKTVVKTHVKDRYKFVAHHDRVGRLADTQEFLYLILPKEKFDQPLLDDLLNNSSEEVSMSDTNVILKSVYLERKMVPLDIYVKTQEERKSIDAIIDYGNAIKELAHANIFPGDLLMKNFGVTSEGRVIFYDYDEIVKVTECNFRTFPEYSDSEYDDMDYYSAEPSYHVAPEDVFPQEFEKFLIPNGWLKDIFLNHHSDLFTAKYWQSIQEKIRSRA